jgi:hypothetical protein
MTVRHEISDITPQEFDIVPKQFSFRVTVTLQEDTSSVLFMKGFQFLFISNSATTGHKLQGCTLTELAVFEQYYGQNWMHVVLSRCMLFLALQGSILAAV